MNYNHWLDSASSFKNGSIQALQELPESFPSFSISAFESSVSQLRSRLNHVHYFSAPMTHASGAAFRQLVRGYLTEADGDSYIGFTQMYTADALPYNPLLWNTVQSTPAPGEKIILQLCGNSPISFKKATEMLRCSATAPQIVALDINLGCPAKCASSRGYGFYVAQNWPLVHQIVSEAASTGAFPITCKIRPLETPEKTAEYMYLLAVSGAAGITIHMRHTKRQGRRVQSVQPEHAEFAVIFSLFKRKMDALFDSRGHTPGTALTRMYPVMILNGGIKDRQEADHLLASLPIDGVMVGMSLLKNPACLSKSFGGVSANRSKSKEFWIKAVIRYLDLCEELANQPVNSATDIKVVPMASHKEVIGHVMQLLHHVFARRFNEPINKTKSIAELRETLKDVLSLAIKSEE